MQSCLSTASCAPGMSGWAAALLVTITVYGVLEILSLFTLAVHWRDPTRTGARILRVLGILDLASAALAPLLIYAVLDAPSAAAAVVILHLVLAGSCRTGATRTGTHEPATARALR